MILAEERTTDAERCHIIDARRRAAAKLRKLKSLGLQGEEEAAEDESGEGEWRGWFQ